jgi:hypothetical protein
VEDFSTNGCVDCEEEAEEEEEEAEEDGRGFITDMLVPSVSPSAPDDDDNDCITSLLAAPITATGACPGPVSILLLLEEEEGPNKRNTL